MKMPRASRRAREGPPHWQLLGLRAVGLLTALYGGWYLFIALGLGQATAGDADLRVLAGGVGAATVLAGLLALVRRREDLVGAILGGATAAAFALGAARMTQPDAQWGVLFPAAIFGGLLVGFLAFRDAFRARDVDPEA
jgi:hypothetical protein